MFVKNVKMDDKNSDVGDDDDGFISSFDRLCKLFVYASDVERRASKGLRECSLKKREKKP